MKLYEFIYIYLICGEKSEYLKKRIQERKAKKNKPKI